VESKPSRIANQQQIVSERGVAMTAVHDVGHAAALTIFLPRRSQIQPAIDAERLMRFVLKD
jgi:hypothetical protein